MRQVPIFVRVGRIDEETSKNLTGQHYNKRFWVQVLDCEDACQNNGMSSINGMTEYVTQIWRMLPGILSADTNRAFPKEPISILWLDEEADIVNAKWQYDPTRFRGTVRGWHATHTSFEYLSPKMVQHIMGEKKPES